MWTFIEVVNLIGSRKSMTPSNKPYDSIKAAIYILTNTESIEMALPFWVNAIEVLKKETKRIL